MSPQERIHHRKARETILLLPHIVRALEKSERELARNQILLISNGTVRGAIGEKTIQIRTRAFEAEMRLSVLSSYARKVVKRRLSNYSDKWPLGAKQVRKILHSSNSPITQFNI